MKKQFIHTCLLILFFLLPSLTFQVAIPYAASIKIAWNANQEQDLAGYKIYYGNESGHYATLIDVGIATSYQIDQLQEGMRYYITLTAYDRSTNESTKSTEVSGIAVTPATTTVTYTETTSSSTVTSTIQSSTTSTLPAATTSSSLPTPPPSTSTSSTAFHPSSTTSVLITLPTTTILMSTTSQPSTSSTVEPSSTTIKPDIITASCNDQQLIKPLSVNTSAVRRSFFPADNIIDGDLRTVWVTFLSLFKNEADIILDMGSMKIITSLSLYSTRMFGVDYFPDNTNLQISSDHVNWKTINPPSSKTSGAEDAYAQNWLLNGHICRYIKIGIKGRKTFIPFQLVQIAELEIYGCEQTDDNQLFGDGQNLVTDTHRPHSSILHHTARLPVQSSPAPSIPGKPIVIFE